MPRLAPPHSLTSDFQTFMAAQSLANRTPRAQTGSEDAVLARAVEFARWARRHARVIIATAVIAALVLGTVIYLRVNQAQREERAATELMKLERTVSTSNPQLAARDLQNFVQRFQGTTAAEEARIALAQLHLQTNEPAKAVALLKGAADDIDDSPVGPQSALLLAAAQSAAGDQKAALATYLAVADETDEEFRRTEALEQAAMLRMQTGDFGGAAELYQRLASMLEEGDPQRQLYEMRRVEAQAKAEAR